MRGAPSPGASGSTHLCAPREMRQALVFIAVTPTAPRASPSSLESGLIHGFSACFAVPLHTEELEPRYRSPGSPVPIVLQISTQLCTPELSPLMGDEEDAANSMHPCLGKRLGPGFAYRWPYSY